MTCIKTGMFVGRLPFCWGCVVMKEEMVSRCSRQCCEGFNESQLLTHCHVSAT